MTSNIWAVHPFVSILAAEKARGVILGAALGDACGLYTEFLPAAEAQRTYGGGLEFGVTPLRGDQHRDKFSLVSSLCTMRADSVADSPTDKEQGAWTDDTDHALLLVLSVLNYHAQNRSESADRKPSAAFLAQDFACRLKCWCEQGLLALSTPRLGLGATIGRIANDPAFLDDPKALARRIWVKAGADEKPASNGSLMRSHPLGVIAADYDTEVEAFELAAEVSRVTHAEPRCTLASCAFIGVLRGLVRGEINKETDLNDALDRAEAYMQANPELSEAELESGAASDPCRWLKLDEYRAYTSKDVTFDTLKLDEAMKIGYVYKCFGAGILSLRLVMRQLPNAETFERQILNLTLQGGDADTNASVAGALLGAWLGETRLPLSWLQRLRHHEWLREKATRFVAAVGIPDNAGDQAWLRRPRDADANLHGGRVPLTKDELRERETQLLIMMAAKERARREEAARSDETSKRWNFLRRNAARR